MQLPPLARAVAGRQGEESLQARAAYGSLAEHRLSLGHWPPPGILRADRGRLIAGFSPFMKYFDSSKN